MFVNVIKSYRDVVAICDKELIGKKFEEGNFQLDVKENFFSDCFHCFVFIQNKCIAFDGW